MSGYLATAVATVIAALIGSGPAWTALYLSNRRALRRQTRQITEQVSQSVATQIQQHAAASAGKR